MVGATTSMVRHLFPEATELDLNGSSDTVMGETGPKILIAVGDPRDPPGMTITSTGPRDQKSILIRQSFNTQPSMHNQVVPDPQKLVTKKQLNALTFVYSWTHEIQKHLNTRQVCAPNLNSKTV